MSKEIKQMQMDALKQTFQDVRDLVLLSSTKLSAQAENQLRLALRKKNIQVQMVKNSLARRVFGELGCHVEKAWEGPTLVAWGAGSLAELSRELEAQIKKAKQVQAKAALCEGQEISFDQALKMPTKTEAIGLLIALILSPSAAVAGQVQAPAGQIAGQVQTLSEKEPEGEAAPAAAAV